MLLDEVDAAVEAYESACEAQAGEEVDLRAFAPPADSPHYVAVVVELIRVDMERRWHQTSGSRIEHYRALFPEILSRRDCLTQIAFEEYRLRLQAHEAVDRHEYERTYRIDATHWPELTSAIASIYATRHPDFHALSASEPHLARSLAHADNLFPHVGETLWGFRLLEELGRGAFGRVYLAQQTGLADRLVALKVTAGVSHEPIKLAQLQHTHIVPIYSQHGDGALQGFCMPFLGRTTLAQSTATRKSKCKSGSRSLITTVRNSITDTNPVHTSGSEQVQVPLASAGQTLRDERQQIRYVAQLAQKLATGLQHAHERGIVHCDLKPANILISDAGEPLILDFHIAQARASGAAAVIGGTLPYMSPEQLIAFEHGGDVDARSDIFALGVILFELLSGALPFPTRKGTAAECLRSAIPDRAHAPTNLSELNPDVSPGLANIVSKCLAHDPQRRYASAQALAEDLDCHLHALPLRHAPDRSPAERLHKWCRRHPRLASSSTVGIVSIVLLISMAVGWRWREDTLAAAAANSEFHEVDRELPVLWGLADAETLDAQQRAEFQNRARGIAAHYPLGDGANWRRQPSIARLPPDHQEQLLDQLRTIAFLQAELALRDAQRASAARRVALLKDAESAQRRLLQLELGPDDSAAVAHQEARLAALRRDDATPPRLANSAEAKSTSSLDRRLLALQYVSEHRHAQALPLLEALASQHPDDVALLLQLGNCYRALERWPAAEGCYTACAALRPDLAFPFYYRGLLQLEQQQYAPAVKNFGAALERDETASAHMNLGLAYRGLGDHREAVRHFERAIELHSPETRVWLLLAQSREQLDDRAGAAAAHQKWRETPPTDALSWIARGVEQLGSDPAAAEASFRAALELDPDSPAALQNLSHVFAERRQQPQAAIDVLTQALRSAPDDPLLLGSRAVLHARLGSAEAARDDAAAAVKLAPRSGLAWYQSACVEALLARDDSAARDRALAKLEVAVALEPALGGLFLSDSDLQAIHDLPRLREIVALAARLEAAALSPRSAPVDGEE